MKEYDYVFAGGGAAGLSLAYHICRSGIQDPQILIIDRENKERSDRIWGFWSDRATPFDHVVYHVWDQVQFFGRHFHQTYNLDPYRYKVIRSMDFYHAMHGVLSSLPGIDFCQAKITSIQDNKSGTQIIADEQAFTGRWVFDSTFQPYDLYGPPRYHYLKQHFKWWEIETHRDAFNPSAAILYDFRTPNNKSDMRYFYLLPYTKRRAMVQFTVISTMLLKPNEYDRAISEYIEKVLDVADYRIDAVATGVIPLTDRPFVRQSGNRVMMIGAKGGRIKPSTGQAFTRIQQDSAKIVRSITDHGHPFKISPVAWRHRLFDTLMLQMMLRRGDQMEAIFTRLFRNNSIHQIFRLLDETGPPTENLRVLSSLELAPFLKAFFRVKLLRRI